MIKVCAISDTHRRHRAVKVPECDLLLHAGDITATGKFKWLEDFDNWIGELKDAGVIDEAVVIAGNHDLSLETMPEIAETFFKNSVYLHNETFEYNGIKIYGTPYQPEFCDWAFNVPREKMKEKVWDRVPKDIDILLTHGPPAGHIGGTLMNDDDAGCKAQQQWMYENNPPAIVCGHIHWSRNVYYPEKVNTVVINSAICTEQYRPTNEPILFDINENTKKVSHLKK